MDCSGMETTTNDICVNEGAFWHSNMDLYFGYQPGEVVEVEHESNKYWLATIEYSFKNLVLLKWIGNYGEFWIETSQQNSFNNSSFFYNEFGAPKRIFPPGYHLQSRLKSQFTLERPTRVLIKPSSYNPANDPYAEIKTVDDLLTHEIDQNNTFESQSSASNEPASIVLAKCKTKIAYGQEDVDELEAALQNLNEIDSDGNDSPLKSPKPKFDLSFLDDFIWEGQKKDVDESLGEVEFICEKKYDESEDVGPASQADSLKVDSQSTANDTMIPTSALRTKLESQDQHEACLDICKNLQESAISKGRYLGIEKNQEKVYYLKPKQFFELGGANHERVLVPGTLLEISHCLENTSGGLDLYHWFAYVLKNVGGRLTLRWYLCDEPKFKQGRLEPKSCQSQFVLETEDFEDLKNKGDDLRLRYLEFMPHSKDLTFCMHFCDPRLHTIGHARSIKRPYKMTSVMSKSCESQIKPDGASVVQRYQMETIFDIRRMNLDKDRPIIDHLLSTVRWMRPQYVNLSFAPKDTDNPREVLLSSPKATKLFKGFVKRELEPGVFEVHSEPMPETGEIIKFIYPYDSSYSILPTSWATKNQDCLSVDPSRNVSPTPTEKSSTGNSEANSSKENDQFDRTEPDHKPTETECLKSNTQREIINASKYTLLCEIPKSNVEEKSINETTEDGCNVPEEFDEMEPSYWSRLIRTRELQASEFNCKIDYSSMDKIVSKFKVMDQLEVVHPSSDVTICLGRIRKVAYPLLWIQISPDSYTLLPFNSTDIYPYRWCETNNHPLISLLPPRKRIIQSTQPDKKRKKTKTGDSIELDNNINQRELYEKESFDLNALNDKQLDIDYILNEKSMYIRIYFNHKCFTGPSLSKGKICSLPQYVGPGPLRLVMEEVVTKVISVAYVPPRILNDLSSKSFEELLIARNLTNTGLLEFKAKYQKRVHRETIPVCLNPDDVTLYCECVCEHLKCCYNLFGPNLYDGDDCPGHCRALTKSNKFMKRATYYREKARLGEFINDNGSAKKASNNNSSNKTSRARYAGRDSSESTSSSISRSEQMNSRSSSAIDEIPVHELKENLVVVEEEVINEVDAKADCVGVMEHDANYHKEAEAISDSMTVKDQQQQPPIDSENDKILHQSEQVEHNAQSILTCKPHVKWSSESEFNMFDARDLRPEEWTVEDVAMHLDWCRLACFTPYMVSEGVDGQALLLMDKIAIREHFQHRPKVEFTPEEVGKLCRFVEYVKTRAETTGI